MAARRFVPLLLLIAVGALGLRVAYVLTITRHDALSGDQIYYSALANTLARGEGFRDPFVTDRALPSADHPPLTSIVAAPASWIMGTDPGDDPGRAVLAQRLTMALVGALGVVAIGFAARSLVEGERRHVAGLAAAGLAAVYPGLWINDGLVMSESAGALTVALVIWAAVRAMDRPTVKTMAVVGAAVGLAALARAEVILLAPLLLIPIALTRRGRRDLRPPAAAVKWFAAVSIGCGLVLAPWVIPNMVRFDKFTTLSTNDGLTLLGSYCPPAYHGDSTGLWVLSCIKAVDSNHDGVDDWTAFQRGESRIDDNQDYSDVSTQYRSAALRYAKDHAGDFPRVAITRLGRVWGVYGVSQAAGYYNVGEGRHVKVSWAAAIGFWIVAPIGLAGMFVLRRRRRPVWPLAVQLVATTVVAVAFYGLWRFRIGAEVALVMAAGVAFEAATGWWSTRSSARSLARPEVLVE